MPKVTIWIRVEDYPKWESLANVPEFIHNALNPVGSVDLDKMLDEREKYRKSQLRTISDKPKRFGKPEIQPEAMIIDTPKDAEKATGWAGSNFKKGKKK